MQDDRSVSRLQTSPIFNGGFTMRLVSSQGRDDLDPTRIFRREVH